jgi:hypothetical protein
MHVRLHYASLPLPIGLVSVHCWFTVTDPASRRCDRWEIWQRPDAGGVAIGHLHCNLKAPEAGVGGGPTRLLAEWQGPEAFRIKETLEKAEGQYPWCRRYLPWPGPNSNTFAAWVLRRAGIDYRLPWKAIGRNYTWPER